MAEHGDLQGARRDLEATLSQVLEWLWDTVAEPVLAALGFDDAPEEGQPWPRLWWCPTGLLTLFPLHAAGYHGTADGHARSVLDRVVSSYTPERSRHWPGPTARARRPRTPESFWSWRCQIPRVRARIRARAGNGTCFRRSRVITAGSCSVPPRPGQRSRPRCHSIRGCTSAVMAGRISPPRRKAACCCTTEKNSRMRRV